MTVSIAQLDAHLKAMKGKYNTWPGIGGPECMVVFASVNQLLGGPAYSAPGAKDLWGNPALGSAYRFLPASTAPIFGDIAIHGELWGNGWGHISVVVENINSGSYRGFGQNPGAAATTVLAKAGLLGYLRPLALAAAPAAKPKPPARVLVNRQVGQTVAWVRTRPDHTAPLVAAWPSGIKHPSLVAVKGYVSGTDPFGTGDDAWYVTVNDGYLWANAAGNDLTGLPRL